MFDWNQLRPDDGYFAAIVQLHTRTELVFGLKVGGELVKRRTVSAVDTPDPEIVGLFKRRLIVLQAMAEYLNAGGDLRDLRLLMPHPDEGSVWTEGWTYFDGGVEPDSGNWVHEFANADYTRFVRWVRNEYIDTNLTLEDISDDTIRPPSPAAHLDLDDPEAEGQADREDHRLPGP